MRFRIDPKLNDSWPVALESRLDDEHGAANLSNDGPLSAEGSRILREVRLGEA